MTGGTGLDRSPGDAGRRPEGTLRLAHRGDHRLAPENTLAAFEAALALATCDGLEFDVRLSRDGVPVILHDETLARVQGLTERADALSTAELRRLAVPTLEEVLAATPPQAFLNVELKIDTGRAALDVLRAARGPGFNGGVVSSFDVSALEAVGAIEPGWARWLNVEELTARTLDLALDLGCRGISVEWRAIDARSAAAVRDRGLALAAWTVRRRPTVRRLAGLGLAAVGVEGSALDT